MANRNTSSQQPTQPLSIISSSRRRSSIQPTTTHTTTIIPPQSLSSPTSGPLPAGTIIEQQRSPSSGIIDESGVDGSRIQRVIYTHASDRFFERRRDPHQQQPASPSSGGRYYGREHRY
uniref:Uncharacterized protein n=1 Tax=Panagrolaimus sp. PS1159 TaxID=55785 RepID=A0AC35G980_9BILA